jgi:glutamyl-tRNA reductase
MGPSMLNLFHVTQYPAGYSLPQIPSPQERSSFVLSTCLRTLVLDICPPSTRFLSMWESSSEKLIHLHGDEAYIFVLEVLCGLHSKIIGENEIVSQFKTAFHQYLQSQNKHPWLIKILEKLLKDSKEVRAKYLLGVGSKGYARLARKILMDRLTMNPATEMKCTKHKENILIVGSGALAQDLIGQFEKKFHVHITARNNERLQELKNKFPFIELQKWQNLRHYFTYGHIVCAIGGKNNQSDQVDKYFTEDFFVPWIEKTPQHRLFVDLGEPSCLDHPHELSNHGIVKLHDLFHIAQKDEEDRLEKIHLAKEFILKLVLGRTLLPPTDRLLLVGEQK